MRYKCLKNNVFVRNDALYNLFKLYLIKNQSKGFIVFPPCLPRFLLLRVGRNK